MHAAVYPLIAGITLFVYYTVWVFVLPFIPEEEFAAFHEYFPPRVYAFALPAAGLTATIAGAIAVFLFPAAFDPNSAAARAATSAGKQKQQ